MFDPLEPRRLLSVALSPSAWTPIGPAPIPSGQTPGGLSVSGRVYAIAINPSNSNQYYAATGGGGVWRSDDGGASWSPLTDSQATLFTGAIAIAPSNPNVIYAGTGNPTVATYSYTGRGVLKSIDGGTTWSLVGATTFNREAISQIVVSPSDPNAVYVAVSQEDANGGTLTTGIFKAINGGTTWTNTTASISTSDAFTDLVIDPTNAQTLYCAVGNYIGAPANGVYKTTNGGTSWAPAGNFAMGIANGATRLAISKSSPQVLYAAVTGTNVVGSSSLGTLYKMYRSGNGGTTWQELSNTPDYLAGAGFFASALTVSPNDPDVVYAAGFSGLGSVIRSIDAGQTWSSIGTVNGVGPHMLHHGLTVDSSGRLIDASDGGIYRYDPSANQWSSLNATLNITQLNSIALDPSTRDIAWVGAQDNGTNKFTFSNGNITWSQKRQDSGGVVRVDFAAPNTVYHEYAFGSSFIQRSTDGGTNWSNKTSGISTTDDSNLYPPLVMDPSTSTRLIVGTNRVYLSSNRGDSWSAISTTNSNGWTTAEPIDALAIAKASAGTIYASAGGNVYVTTNGGSTWNLRDPVSSPSTDLDFTDIAIDPTNSQIAYIVAANFSDLTGGPHVWKTINGGTSWTNISGNLPDAPVWSMALDPNGPGSADDILYIGTDAGVYRSANAGATWAAFATALPNAQVRDLEYNQAMGLLAAGTYGRGLWEIAVPPVVFGKAYNDELAQHALTFQFTQNVQSSLSPADLQVTNRVTGVPQTTQLLSYDTSTNTATFVFTEYPNGTLPDGDYRAVLFGAEVTNSAGASIQSDTTFDFFHFTGDANHDRMINSGDFTVLAQNFNRVGTTFSQGNFNYDGSTNALDFNILATNFGTTFTPPPSVAVESSITPDLFSTLEIVRNDDVLL